MGIGISLQGVVAQFPLSSTSCHIHGVLFNSGVVLEFLQVGGLSWFFGRIRTPWSFKFIVEVSGTGTRRSVIAGHFRQKFLVRLTNICRLTFWQVNGTWTETFECDAQAHRTEHGFFPVAPPRESSSLVLQCLSGGTSSGWCLRAAPLESGGCVGVLKEREMGEEEGAILWETNSRVRLYRVAADNRIGPIFEFVSQRIMAGSEERSSRHLVYVALDFSSWCTSFRPETAVLHFQELDYLFGIRSVYACARRFPLESVLLF